MGNDNRRVITRYSLLVLTVLIIHIVSVGAMVGVSPPLYKVDFKPNLKQTFHFEFMANPDDKFDISAEGDLAQYVELNTKKLNGPGVVEVTLNLPSDIPLPGEHSLFISAKQLPNSNDQGVFLVGNIKGLILVEVPYPNQYASLYFEVPNVKAGDTVPFKVVLYSLGKETLQSEMFIDIYDMADRKVANIPLGLFSVEPAKSQEIHSELKTTKDQAGAYKAIAVAKYSDKITQVDKMFRLGENFVNITGTSDDFERDKFVPIDIGIESFWNDPIQNVFAEVEILNYDIKFKTPSVDLGGFEKAHLRGFFSTSSIKEDSFQAKITLKYNGKTTERVVDLHFKKETNYVLIALIGAVILAILILLWVVRWSKGKRKR